MTADQKRELSKKKVGTYFGEEKNAYIALVDQLGVKKGKWFSGEVRMLTKKQAEEKLKKGRISRMQLTRNQ